MAEWDDLPSRAHTLLDRLRARHSLMEVDIYLLPVNVGTAHWFLLSADVDEGQCVVRVHDPSGLEGAESRFAAGKGFSALIWRFRHPGVDVIPTLTHDV